MATATTTDFATRTSASATSSCTTATPGKYGHVPLDACNSQYPYNPSFEGNLAFAVLFGLVTIAHLVLAIIYKKRYCWVIIMGGIWETAGFAIKTIGTRNQQETQFAIWGQILFLLSPLWINAFVYMTVARMIYFSLPEKKIWGIRAIRLTVIFIWLDVFCFLVQGGGGALLSNNDSQSTVRTGQKIYMAGIGVQMAFILLFGVMTAWFYYRLVQIRGHDLGRIKFLIWTMLAVLILVTIRIIYRLCEFGPGVNDDNPILTHEAYPFGLDAAPMLIALALLAAMHPGFVLRGPDSDFPRLTRAEKKALKQEKKDEKRRQKAAKKARKEGGYELEEGFTPEETEYRGGDYHENRSNDSDASRRGLMV
ncbi:Fc.00g092020.m01.CDS01 [Cosmosporella sp. VM-42]